MEKKKKGVCAHRHTHRDRLMDEEVKIHGLGYICMGSHR